MIVVVVVGRACLFLCRCVPSDYVTGRRAGRQAERAGSTSHRLNAHHLQVFPWPDFAALAEECVQNALDVRLFLCRSSWSLRALSTCYISPLPHRTSQHLQVLTGLSLAVLVQEFVEDALDTEAVLVAQFAGVGAGGRGGAAHAVGRGHVEAAAAQPAFTRLYLLLQANLWAARHVRGATLTPYLSSAKQGSHLSVILVNFRARVRVNQKYRREYSLTLP